VMVSESELEVLVELAELAMGFVPARL